MKPILFVDFNGTICFDRYWRNLNNEAQEKINDFLFKSNKQVVIDWMRGKYDSEQIHQILAQELELDYRQTWDIFIEECRSMYISPRIMLRIKEIGSKFKTILITDNMDCFSRFTVVSLKLDQYFEQIINSADTKIFKDDNDGEVFRKLAAENEINLSDCMLLDDSKTTQQIFSNLGGKSLLVNRENTAETLLEIV